MPLLALLTLNLILFCTSQYTPKSGGIGGGYDSMTIIIIIIIYIYNNYKNKEYQLDD